MSYAIRRGGGSETPPWHKDVLERHQAKIAEGHAEYLTLEELVQQRADVVSGEALSPCIRERIQNEAIAI